MFLGEALHKEEWLSDLSRVLGLFVFSSSPMDVLCLYNFLESRHVLILVVLM